MVTVVSGCSRYNVPLNAELPSFQEPAVQRVVRRLLFRRGQLWNDTPEIPLGAQWCQEPQAPSLLALLAPFPLLTPAETIWPLCQDPGLIGAES